jgi:hypothetical protein
LSTGAFIFRFAPCLPTELKGSYSQGLIHKKPALHQKSGTENPSLRHFCWSDSGVEAKLKEEKAEYVDNTPAERGVSWYLKA